MKLKKVQLDDWELLRTLEEASATKMYAPCEGEEGYKKYIEESTVYFIMDKKNAVGTISYEIQKDGKCVINGLTVKPEHRSRGIARQAMEYLLNEIDDREIELVVHPENIPALLIYLHLGFIITKWEDNHFGDGEPRLHLKKKSRKGRS